MAGRAGVKPVRPSLDFDNECAGLSPARTEKPSRPSSTGGSKRPRPAVPTPASREEPAPRCKAQVRTENTPKELRTPVAQRPRGAGVARGPRRPPRTHSLCRNGSREGRTGEVDNRGSASPHGMTVWRRTSEDDLNRRQRSHRLPRLPAGGTRSPRNRRVKTQYDASRASEPPSRPLPWEPAVRCRAPPSGRGDPGPAAHTFSAGGGSRPFFSASSAQEPSCKRPESLADYIKECLSWFEARLG